MQALRRVSIHQAMFWQIGAKPLHSLKAVGGGKLGEKTLPANDGRLQFLQSLLGAPAFTAWEGRGLTLSYINTLAQTGSII